jgi:lipoprotein signal peptidase
MNVFTKKLIILSFLIIGIDLLTKLLALNLLPFENQVRLIGERVCFYLTYNLDSTGGQADYLMRAESNKNLSILLSSLIGIILLSYIVIIFSTKISKSIKWLIGIGIFIICVIISELLKPYLANIVISNWTASVLAKTTAISLYLLIFMLSKNNYIRLFLIIIISAGLGNLINHFYSPFRVIDFIDIKGSYELFKIGVFNLADIFFDIGLIGFFITLFIILIKKIFTAHNKPAAAMRGQLVKKVDPGYQT